MFRFTVAFLAIVSLAGVTRAADPVADELKNLQGQWQAVETLLKGERRDKDDTSVRGLRFVIKGEELIVAHPSGNGQDRRKTIKLDPTKSPKEINLLHLDGAEKDQTTAAIYKLETDRLTICMPYFNGDLNVRPTEFNATADDGRMVIVLERSK